MIKYVVFHPWQATTILILGVVLGTTAFYAYALSSALGVVATEDFNPEAARAAIGEATPDPEISALPDIVIEEPGYDINAEIDVIKERMGETINPRDIHPNSVGEPIDDGVFESYLLLGTDASGYLADAIILALQPTDRSTPILVSLPRDLYVWNLCKGRFSRLNEGLNGCVGSASGSELMAIMVEDYTGIPVDHLARINFGGFARLVNAMGGVTVCVDHPTRDLQAHLELESAGCQRVDGETALAWVRSRHPEQLIGEDWVPTRGSDFTRQRHQQDVLFQLAGKAASFSSPASLADRLSAVASSVRLDSSWSFGQAVATGWRYRGISKSSVDRFTISVIEYRSPAGAAVLLPAKPFIEQLSEYYEID